MTIADRASTNAATAQRHRVAHVRQTHADGSTFCRYEIAGPRDVGGGLHPSCWDGSAWTQRESVAKAATVETTVATRSTKIATTIAV